jgi:hypothetical protein
MDTALPKDVIASLWSYDIDKIDPEKHKKIIISQTLNWGSEKAVDWLFDYYSKEEVIKIAESIPVGQWDKKSLNFWSLILGIRPKERIS